MRWARALQPAIWVLVGVTSVGIILYRYLAKSGFAADIYTALQLLVACGLIVWGTRDLLKLRK